MISEKLAAFAGECSFVMPTSYRLCFFSSSQFSLNLWFLEMSEGENHIITIGVLALQGAFAEHVRSFNKISGVKAIEVHRVVER